MASDLGLLLLDLVEEVLSQHDDGAVCRAYVLQDLPNSRRTILLMGSSVMLKMDSSRREFRRSFSKKYRASSNKDPNTLFR